MGTKVDFRPCPKCRALIAVVLEKGTTRCRKCWEGVFEVEDDEE